MCVGHGNLVQNDIFWDEKFLKYNLYSLKPFALLKTRSCLSKQLETKIYWVRKNFKCLGRVFWGISYFTEECAFWVVHFLNNKFITYFFSSRRSIIYVGWLRSAESEKYFLRDPSTTLYKPLLNRCVLTNKMMGRRSGGYSMSLQYWKTWRIATAHLGIPIFMLGF